ncbi:MAG: tRNA epoxyqueuosine(34) reductase QueG [Firmicutes bacterium]|nr:tRNA epoxyqueuosine(34) reductase QueG [Bacillota bacterium]
MTTLKTKITDCAKSLGFDLVKVTDAKPLPDAEKRLMEILNSGHDSTMVSGSPEERTAPQRILPGAKSVVVVAMSYSVKLDRDTDAPHSPDWTSRLNLSRYAWGQDYHHVLRARLLELADYMKQLVSGTESKVLVDTGPLAEKAVAYKAGIGVYGWNSCMITEKWGSWVFLGSIITTLHLEPDLFNPGTCQQCGRCIKACPTNAIIAPYIIDAERCLSQITQARGIVPKEFRKPIGKRLFGCDTCQAVCPHNNEKKIAYGNHEEFFPHPDVGAEPTARSVLSMDNHRFNDTFRHTAAGWRGRKVLQRNAAICLGNIGSPADIPILIETLADPSEPVRAAAAWALGEISKNADDAARALIKEKLFCAKISAAQHNSLRAEIDEVLKFL